MSSVSRTDARRPRPRSENDAPGTSGEHRRDAAAMEVLRVVLDRGSTRDGRSRRWGLLAGDDARPAAVVPGPAAGNIRRPDQPRGWDRRDAGAGPSARSGPMIANHECRIAT